jgi:trehalose 6-phosphate synthase
LPLKREVTPPGPVTILFDRLHELHLNAGEPGVRQIASGIGRGVVSHTTVHNVFRGPRVPRWGTLELIVEELNGEIPVFRELWKAARSAELTVRLDVPDPAVTSSWSDVTESRYDLVVVNHRVPSELSFDSTSSAAQLDLRGIEMAMLDMIRRNNGVWLGTTSAALSHDGPAIARVELSAEEISEHYNGYCSSTIWPVYHCMTTEPDFGPAGRECNRRINERFSESVVDLAARGATVQVHDYHLQLVPEMVRRLRPDVRVGFFLHTPFPPVEVFRRLPDREEILRGVLGAAAIGFQDPLSADNFLRTVVSVLRLPVDGGRIGIDGRVSTVGVFPVSVATGDIAALAAQPQVRRRAAEMRADLGDPRTVFSGLDRLDYTKGVVDRFNAYGELLRDGRLPADRTAFVQFTGAHREDLPEYASLRARIEQIAGRLNGEYGRVGRPVVHYSRSRVRFDDVVALYVATDVMVVTPVRDGMNLIAKEYAASRIDDTGVLVLSEFAGAANELDGALIVNPYDAEALKAALVRAAAMDPAEQAQRMRRMRRHLMQHDIHRWCSSFLAAVRATGPRLDLV